MASPVHRATGVLALGALAFAWLGACGGGDVVIGDDTTPDAAHGPDASDIDAARADGSAPDADAAPDATPDAAPGSCEALGGACASPSVACRKKDTSGATCAAAGTICCLTPCPQLAPPAPGLCDGGPTAAVYDADACVVSYACAPITCAAGGGQCVAISPGSCATNHFGDAAKYSCGPGIGVGCCLP